MSFSKLTASYEAFSRRMFPTQEDRQENFENFVQGFEGDSNDNQPGPKSFGCTLPPVQEYMLKALEDFVSTVIRLAQSDTWAEWFHVLWDLVRLRTGKSSFSAMDAFYGKIIEEIRALFAVKQQGIMEDSLKFFRQCLDSVDMFEKSAIAGKVYELFCYILANGMMGLCKVPCVAKELGALFGSYKETRYESKLGFLKCLLDFAVFIFERIGTYMAVGSLKEAFFTEADVAEWFVEAQELTRLNQNFSNLGALKLTEDWDQYSFIIRLDNAISKGTGYCQALKRTSRKDLMLVQKHLQALKLARENNLSRAEASKFRDPPFAFLLFGTSCIGKSLYMQNAISHCCKVMGWPIDDNQMYAFMSGEKHHDGCFDGKRIIIVDEIGYEKADKVMNVADSSVGNVLRINNTAPFILPMAALELKGKVTFRPQLVIGTTNVMHMNASSFFSCPLAVRRRFPFVVELVMKPQYSTDGMLDPVKVPPSVGYADIWHIKIYKIVAKNPSQDQTKYKDGTYEVDEELVFETDSSVESYAFLAKSLVQHFVNVKKAKAAYEEGKTVEICRSVGENGEIKGCFFPKTQCRCVHLQAGEEDVVEQTAIVRANVATDHPPQFRSWEWVWLRLSLGRDVWRYGAPSSPKFQIYWACYCLLATGLGWPVFILHLVNGSLFHYALGSPDGSYQPWHWGVGGLMILVNWILMIPGWMFLGTLGGFGYKFYSDTQWRMTFLNFRTFIRMWRTDGWTKATRYMLFLSVRLIGKRVEETLTSVIPKEVVSSLVFFSAGYLLARSTSTVVSACVKLSEYTVPRKEVKEEAPPKLVATPAPEPPPASKEELEEIMSFMDDHLEIQSGEDEIPIPVRENLLVEEPEPENVWFKDDFELTHLHLTPTSLSLKGMDRALFLAKVSDNLFCLSVHRPERGPTKWSRGKLFCLHENFFLTQKHFFKDDYPARVRVYKTSIPIQDDGIKDYQEFWVDRHQIVHEAGENIVMFLPALSMGKSMISVLSAQPLGGSHEAVLVRRQVGCDGTDINLSRVVYGRCELPDLNLQMDDYARWEGDKHSMDGDCASPLVIFTHYGPVIYGFHVAGTTSGPAIGYALRLDLGSLLQSLMRHGVNFKHSIMDACLPLAADTAVRTLEPLHLKSPVRFIQNGCAQVFGSLTGPRAAPKSMVAKTPLCAIMQREGYEIKWGAPTLSGWRPKHRVLKQAVGSESQWNVNMLEFVREDFFRHIKDSVAPVTYAPLSTEDAINGVPGVRFLEAMKRKTSAGYPWNKSKLHFLTRVGDKVYLNEEMQKRVDLIELNALNGVIVHPIYTAALKDEALKLSKILEYATRVFYGMPMDHSIVSRKYWLPMVRFIQSNVQTFCCYAGVNCHSRQWEILARNLVAKCGYANVEGFALARCEALVNDGDFKMFDVSWTAELLYYAIMLLVDALVLIGYSDRDIRASKVLAFGSFNAFVNFFGDLLRLYGIVPSGWILTVIINSIGNRLLIAYCFYTMAPKHNRWRFHEVVFFAAYGDDNLMGIDPRVPWFNHITLAAELKLLGFTFTTADKTGVPTPYRALADVTFLKRSFRYDEDFGHIVAPIEEASIIKSLMMCVRSKSVTPMDQLMGQVSSAVREYAYFGRHVYEEKCAFLRACLIELGIEHMIVPSTFPPFDNIVEAFYKAPTFGHRVLH